jgi:uncharacterized membrane protein YcgQ (UPF0703/DUF1980 family)
LSNTFFFDFHILGTLQLHINMKMLSLYYWTHMQLFLTAFSRLKRLLKSIKCWTVKETLFITINLHQSLLINQSLSLRENPLPMNKKFNFFFFILHSFDSLSLFEILQII